MGLLPCLLRSVTSSLLLEDNSDVSIFEKETQRKVMSPISNSAELDMQNTSKRQDEK